MEARSTSASVKSFLIPVVIPGLLQGKAQTFVQPMLPIFIRVDLGGTDSMVGLIASAYAISQLVSSAPLGVIMQRCGYGKSACLALGLLVVTALLSFGVQSLAVLFMIRLLGGIGVSAFDISRKAYMAANVPNSVRGRVVALLASMQKWAVMVAACLSGVIAQHIATRYYFLSSGWTYRRGLNAHWMSRPVPRTDKALRHYGHHPGYKFVAKWSCRTRISYCGSSSR